MKYKYSLSIRQLSQKIESSVRLVGSPFSLNFHIFINNMLYGGIKDNKIWLMKATPLKFGTQRLFRGKMYEEDGYTVIEGRFCFPRHEIIAYIVVSIVWAVFIGLEHLIWWIVLVFFGIAWLFGFGYLLHRKEEKYVKAFLEKLEREYPI